MEAEPVNDGMKWQAESDARTMEEHAMIMADPKRHERAMKIMNAKMDAMSKMQESMNAEEGKAKKRFSETYKEA